MKNFSLLLLIVLVTLPAFAQKSKYDYNFYGFVRTDFFYNSRDNVSSVNDIFYLYPLNVELDAVGKDLNSVSSSGFFSFVTRMGLDLKGPNIGKAKTTAKIEIDFGGYGNFNTLLRIRQAYVNFAWDGGSSLLVGQSWHPIFGDVMPTISNLCTGAPFQPFNRSPQLRYQYLKGGFKFTAAALTQLQYTSQGINGNSNEYMINSAIPELYIGADYINGGFQAGVGVDILTLKPRTRSTYNNEVYKVDETLRALSGEVHMRYYNKKLKISAKSLLASALDHTLMLGGYGVTTVAATTGAQEYTPIRNSSTWLNVVYGDVWTPILFVGYVKNLGTSEPLYSKSSNYGRGLDIDKLLGCSLGLKYNKPSWIVGVEYSATTAWYGDLNLSTGRIDNPNGVTNNRVVGVFTYLF